MAQRRRQGRLVFELDQINDRHAHVRVFDAGAFCGALTLSHGTWEGMKLVEDPRPGASEGNPSEPSVSGGRRSFDAGAEV